MRTRSARIGLAVLALTLVVPRVAPVAAQPGPASKLSAADKKKIAKGYVDAGLAAQNAGDYATAIELYGKAYDLVPHPILLYNQGQAHRLAGHRAEAQAMYRRFLAETKTGAEVATAKDWLAKMDAEDAAAKAAADQAAADQATKAAAEAAAAEAARVEAARVEAARVEATTEPATASTDGPPADRGRGLRLAGYTAGGLGVAAIGAGVFFGLRASSISDELSQPGAEYTRAREDEGHAAERNMYIGYVAGGVLLAGGATLYLLGRARSHEATQVTLAPRTDGALVVFTGVLP